MRCRGRLLPWVHGAGLYHARVPGTVLGRVRVGRTYSTQPPPPPPRDYVAKAEAVREKTTAVLQNLTDLGSQWGQKTITTASATANYWWAKYEEFVGLNEVRYAQAKVTEAEKAFMVARGVVREAHVSLEALQVRLKEVRDRLDRVSREEAHYLELATSEHRLLQEERRLRTAYENAEGLEREKFSLFSAGVRESHEKERTRAERTKNWSVIGSVLGALIGVMGSTYVNRVRLQELKSLLLEAQKGPVSLQEAIRVQAGMHKSQQDELRGLIDTLRTTLSIKPAEYRETKPAAAPTPAPPPTPLPPPSPSASELALQELVLGGERNRTLVEQLGLQLGQLEQGIGRVGAEMETVRAALERRPPVVAAAVEKPVVRPRESQLLVCNTESVMEGLDQAERRLETQIKRSNLYNTVLTYAAFALTVPALYMIFRDT